MFRSGRRKVLIEEGFTGIEEGFTGREMEEQVRLVARSKGWVVGSAGNGASAGLAEADGGEE